MVSIHASVKSDALVSAFQGAALLENEIIEQLHMVPVGKIVTLS